MYAYLSTNGAHTYDEQFKRIDHLLGDFDVTIYSYKSNFWRQVGNGRSAITNSKKLITEKIEIVKEYDEVIVMNNTFGCERNDNYKLLTLDLTSGFMDVYKGKILGEKLIFCNSDSNTKLTNDFGDSYTFKLIYDQLSSSENQLVVGRSKDNGHTWCPFVKMVYKRKKSPNEF